MPAVQAQQDERMGEAPGTRSLRVRKTSTRNRCPRSTQRDEIMKPKIRPRNPLVAPSMLKKAGSHRKPYKTQRRAERMALMQVASTLRTPRTPRSEPQPKHPGHRCFGWGSEARSSHSFRRTPCKQTSFVDFSMGRGVTSTTARVQRGSETDHHPGLISRG